MFAVGPLAEVTGDGAFTSMINSTVFESLLTILNREKKFGMMGGGWLLNIAVNSSEDQRNSRLLSLVASAELA